jgi:hypothetical protein
MLSTHKRLEHLESLKRYSMSGVGRRAVRRGGSVSGKGSTDVARPGHGIESGTGEQQR